MNKWVNELDYICTRYELYATILYCTCRLDEMRWIKKGWDARMRGNGMRFAYHEVLACDDRCSTINHAIPSHVIASELRYTISISFPSKFLGLGAEYTQVGLLSSLEKR
jgi:hypothetical protein